MSAAWSGRCFPAAISRRRVIMNGIVGCQALGALFPSPLVGEGGAQSAPDEGSLSAETDPSPVSHKGRGGSPALMRHLCLICLALVISVFSARAEERLNVVASF